MDRRRTETTRDFAVEGGGQGQYIRNHIGYGEGDSIARVLFLAMAAAAAWVVVGRAEPWLSSRKVEG